MACLYITEQGSKITTSAGKIIIECRDGTKKSFPKETLESITVSYTHLTLPTSDLV